MRVIGLAVVLALSLALLPLGVEGQQTGKVYRVGILTLVRRPLLEEAALRSLRELGYVEGRNLVLEWRSSEGSNERFADFAAEFVRLNVDLIVAVGNPAAQAAKKATNTIPIVMTFSNSPDQVGLVASLARPGGNVTGLTNDTGPEIVGKMLQLLKETVPTISRVATLRSSGETGIWFEKSGAPVREVDAAGQGLGLTLVPIEARGPDDFATAFAAAAQGRAQALLVAPTGLAFAHRRLIFEFAAKQRLPAVYASREYAEDGGLMSYGVDSKDLIRRATVYIDRILKGAKPADLPVEQPTKFELVINLKTAKALGLTIPQSLLLRADQVIEQ
jgi:putative tryptophan/tyrosine transport system substrate-binding protein